MTLLEIVDEDGDGKPDKLIIDWKIVTMVLGGLTSVVALVATVL